MNDNNMTLTCDHFSGPPTPVPQSPVPMSTTPVPTTCPPGYTGVPTTCPPSYNASIQAKQLQVPNLPPPPPYPTPAAGSALKYYFRTDLH